jgi:hypothetical protein
MEILQKIPDNEVGLFRKFCSIISKKYNIHYSFITDHQENYSYPQLLYDGKVIIEKIRTNENFFGPELKKIIIELFSKLPEFEKIKYEYDEFFNLYVQEPEPSEIEIKI